MIGTNMADELISPRQAADIAECHNDTVRRAIEFGFLRAQRVGRTWAIKRDDLQTWIDAGKPNHRRKSERKTKENDSSATDTGKGQ
jgi:excisionase family DNA binding protein